jgi:hypothetical protein
MQVEFIFRHAPSQVELVLHEVMFQYLDTVKS